MCKSMHLYHRYNMHRRRLFGYIDVWGLCWKWFSLCFASLSAASLRMGSGFLIPVGLLRKRSLMEQFRTLSADWDAVAEQTAHNFYFRRGMWVTGGTLYASGQKISFKNRTNSHQLFKRRTNDVIVASSGFGCANARKMWQVFWSRSAFEGGETTVSRHERHVCEMRFRVCCYVTRKPSCITGKAQERGVGGNKRKRRGGAKLTRQFFFFVAFLNAVHWGIDAARVFRS